MKTSILNVITLSLSLICISSSAMEKPDPSDIYIKNDLLGRFYNNPIQVFYTYKGKGVTRDVNPKETVKLGKTSEFQSIISFSGRGAVLGVTVSPKMVTKEEILGEWLKIRAGDDDPLVIAVSTESWTPPYALTLQYSTKVPEDYKRSHEEQVRKAKRNVLVLFPRVRYWNHLEDKISEDDVLRSESWKDILLKGGMVGQNTTAEDVYRYILELDYPYTAKQVEDALKNALGTFAEKNPEAFARVFKLMAKARKGLLQAIGEKPDLQAHAREAY